MKFYKINAEVPASYGSETVFDRSHKSLKVKSLQLKFEGWFGSDIMKISPVHFVTCSLAEELKELAFTGIIDFEDVNVLKSENFMELYPDRKVPCCKLLRIDGIPLIDDFAKDKGYLIVSQDVIDMLSSYNLVYVDVEPLGKP